ncbi:hypothetical protein [Methylomicrobium lacus]|uniref:hypothetical protein n=1 Tax=Methylomicrobium lacus TaxID=136992 RepID=UPI0035A8C104
MNDIGASILIILIALVFWAPRRWALVGMMAGVLYLTNGQVLNVFGFNLFAIRLLELAGFARVMARKELLLFKLNGIDRVFISLYAYSTLVFLIRSNVGQAYAIGMMVDASLCYFTFRALIISIDDLKWFLCIFVIFLLPYVALLLVEMLTRENPFVLIGGESFVERNGRLRCMGSFRHSSLLGTLGAAFLPLYVALFFDRNNRIRAFYGIGLCLGIVYLSNSGGPLSAAAMGLIGWLFWIFKTKMSLVRRLLVCLIITLASVMEAPIWYLPAKVSSFSGGDGWHRSRLMEVAFEDIDQWWLAGMDLEQTKDWFPYHPVATGVADITNQYLAFGLDSGFLAMVLFIFLITRAFQAIGQALEIVRSSAKLPNDTEYFLWGLGCVILVHISTWLGITYTFDQTYVIWFMHLAAVSSISQACIETKIQAAKDINLGQNRVRQNIYRKRDITKPRNSYDNARI